MIRLRAALARLTPTHAMAAALVASLVVLWYVGRDQWFIRDDWHFVITREEIRHTLGWQDWLFSVNATNLTDNRYYSSCLARGDCFYGQRRTLNATLSYRF